MEKKDIIQCVLIITVIISGIALLMAWNDGYLDGTVIGRILEIVFPALLTLVGIVATVAMWFEILGSVQSVVYEKPFLIAWVVLFIVICVLIISDLSDGFYTISAITIAVALVITEVILIVIKKLRK